MEEEETFTVEVADATGGSIARLTKTAIIEAIQDGSNWLFVDCQMVDANTLESTFITQDNVLIMSPRIHHPSDCPCLNRRTVQTYRDGDYQTEEIPTTNIFGDSWTVFVNGCRSSSIEYQDTEIPSDARIKRLPNIRPRRNRFKTKR